MTTDYPADVPAATTHLNTRRETALLAGAAVRASIEQTVKDLKIFGYIAGDILTNDLKGLNAIRQMLDAAQYDLTALFDEVVASKPAATTTPVDDSADDAVS